MSEMPTFMIEADSGSRVSPRTVDPLGPVSEGTFLQTSFSAVTAEVAHPVRPYIFSGDVGLERTRNMAINLPKGKFQEIL